MKVAISSTGQSLEDKTHELFGRCDFLIVSDTKTKEIKAIKNESADAPSGAGTGCAQIVFDEGAQAVISGKVGPKAYEVLQHAKVDIFLSPPGISIKQALEKYGQGSLQKMEITKY
jgi:predicted Fe-Mo cluster-binding NifX family protein